MMQRRATLLAALTVSLFLGTVAGAQDEVPDAAVRYVITPEKLSDVRITEETPGRFVAVIELTAAEKSDLIAFLRALTCPCDPQALSLAPR